MKQKNRISYAWWPRNRSLVRICGDVDSAVIEVANMKEKIDHVWLQIDVGTGVPVEVSINTLSLRNREHGFDPRIRAGVVRGTWETLPPRGVEAMERFDYADIELENNIFYEHHTREEMETLLVGNAERALRVEAWGMPYHRKRPGIHQVHSRRKSCAVESDVRDRDGGIQFFFAEKQCRELWLFKFCGQP